MWNCGYECICEWACAYICSDLMYIHFENVCRGYVNEKVKWDCKGDTQWNSYVYDDIWGLRELWVKEIKEKGLKLLVTMPL